jgi:hypothetical protein
LANKREEADSNPLPSLVLFFSLHLAGDYRDIIIIIIIIITTTTTTITSAFSSSLVLVTAFPQRGKNKVKTSVP